MRVAVIGGGICGLACAWRLQRLGVEVLLLEQSARVGGVMDSLDADGFLFERGPQSFLSNPNLLELIAALQLNDELLEADRRAPRFVLVRGRLHRVPMAPPTLLSSPLLPLRSRWRILTEGIRKSAPPEPDESVAAFTRRKFGPELLERLVGPLVSGIYAGDPERLSLRAAFPMLHAWERDYGSVVRGAIQSRRQAKPANPKPRPVLSNFRNGLRTLPAALHRALGDAVRTRTTVHAIEARRADGRPSLTIRVTRDGRHDSLAADAVVVATPAYAAATLLAGIAPSAAEQLAGIEYAAVGVVNLGYRSEQVSHRLEGFGFLVPRSEGLRTLGTVWTSSLFAGRAPHGCVALASFVGGATDPEAVRQSEEELLTTVSRENATALGITGAPVVQQLERYPRALPQYNLGHTQRLQAVREELSRLPGVFLAGNYLEGPSIGNCVDVAFRTAVTVAEFLGTKTTTLQPN
jgi:oxygen-dependent protoporphyrinogen oxidase